MFSYRHYGSIPGRSMGRLAAGCRRVGALARGSWRLDPFCLYMRLCLTPQGFLTYPISTRCYHAVGIDLAFIFDGTAYHTARDEMARIRPGTLQVRCATPR